MSVLSYIEESINQQTENLAELEEEICKIREEDQVALFQQFGEIILDEEIDIKIRTYAASTCTLSLNKLPPEDGRHYFREINPDLCNAAFDAMLQYITLENELGEACFKSLCRFASDISIEIQQRIIEILFDDDTSDKIKEKCLELILRVYSFWTFFSV